MISKFDWGLFLGVTGIAYFFVVVLVLLFVSLNSLA